MGFGWGTRKKIDNFIRRTFLTIRTTPVLGGRVKQPIHKHEVTQRFNYLELSKKVVDLDRVPDFLVAGPQRTGTTWLHNNLVQHPQIFMPKRKEIFYFNLLNLPNHSKHSTHDLAWYLSYFYPGPVRYLSNQIRCWRQFREPFRPLIRGEATASLAAMPPELIAEVVELNPQIKVIILVRNPIERAWSHAKLALLRSTGKKLDEVSAQSFERFFQDSYEVDCGHYTKILENWSAVVKEGNAFIGNYTDVAVRPQELLTQLFEFLGVHADQKYVLRQAKEKINATVRIDIPERFLHVLQNIYGEEVARLKASGFSI